MSVYDNPDVEEYDGSPDFVEKNNYRRGFQQWMVDGVKFVPTRKIVKKLPGGFYTIHYNNKLGTYYLQKRTIVQEDLLLLPDYNYQSILTDIQKFWKSEEIYKKYNYIHKRGILLFGPGGCGKTSLIYLLAKDLMDNHNGIVISVNIEEDIYAYEELMASLREIEPNRKIITIFEDIDNLVNEDHSDDVTTKLLNILDGDSKISGIVNIATTNKPDKLKDRIINRPSRFDRRYYIGKPSADNRRFYIENKLKPEDLKNIKIDEWVEKTKDFTLDHLKEIIQSVFILDYTFEDAVREMHNLMNRDNLKMEDISTRNRIGLNR